MAKKKISYHKMLSKEELSKEKDNVVIALDRVDAHLKKKSDYIELWKEDHKTIEGDLNDARKKLASGIEEVTDVPVTEIFYTQTNERRYYDARKGKDTGQLLRIDRIIGDIQLDMTDNIETGDIPKGEKTAKDLKDIQIVEINLEDLPM